MNELSCVRACFLVGTYRFLTCDLGLCRGVLGCFISDSSPNSMSLCRKKKEKQLLK